MFLNYNKHPNATIDKLAEMLKEWNPIVLTGKVSINERNRLIKEYLSSGRRRLILTNVKVGGVSISLQDVTGKYPTISLISPSYSARDQKQAIGRTIRQGVKGVVVVRFIYSKTQVDELRIMTSLNAKKKVMNKLINYNDTRMPGANPEVIEKQIIYWNKIEKKLNFPILSNFPGEWKNIILNFTMCNFYSKKEDKNTFPCLPREILFEIFWYMKYYSYFLSKRLERKGLKNIVTYESDESSSSSSDGADSSDDDSRVYTRKKKKVVIHSSSSDESDLSDESDSSESSSSEDERVPIRKKKFVVSSSESSSSEDERVPIRKKKFVVSSSESSSSEDEEVTIRKKKFVVRSRESSSSEDEKTVKPKRK